MFVLSPSFSAMTHQFPASMKYPFSLSFSFPMEGSLRNIYWFTGSWCNIYIFTMAQHAPLPLSCMWQGIHHQGEIVYSSAFCATCFTGLPADLFVSSLALVRTMLKPDVTKPWPCYTTHYLRSVFFCPLSWKNKNSYCSWKYFVIEVLNCHGNRMNWKCDFLQWKRREKNCNSFSYLLLQSKCWPRMDFPEDSICGKSKL